MAHPKRYNLALVSCAMHQPMYAAVFAQHPQLNIVKVVDDPGQDAFVVSQNQKIAALYGVPYEEGIDRLLDDRQIDVCSVATQIERRGGISAKLAAAGKHLWMDKPNAATLREADAIVAAVRRSGVRTLVYGLHHTAATQRARASLRNGALGQLLSIHWDVIFAKGEAGTLPDGWRTAISPDLTRFTFRCEHGDPSGSGHNVWAKRELHEIGLYPIGLARYLAQSDVTSVYGQLGQYFLKTHADRGLEDFALMHVTFANGVTATVTTGRFGRLTDPGAGVNRGRLVGTRGSLVIDGVAPHALIYGAPDAGGGTDFRQTLPETGGLRESVAHLVECLESGRDSDSTAEDGRAQVEALLAGYASYFAGRPISLPLTRG